MIYMSNLVDSNIFIYAFTDGGKNSRDSKRYLNEYTHMTINTLILLETYNGILKITKDKEYAIRIIRSMMKRDNLKIIDFDINLFFETLKRVKRFDVKFSDIAHYVTGLLNDCDSIITYDKHFDNKNFELKKYEPMRLRE